MANEITKRLLDVYNYSRNAFGLYSAVAFEKRTKLAGGSINKWAKEGKDASIESVVRVLASFPNISAEWLLRGEGLMERNATASDDKQEPSVSSQEYVNRLEDENKFLRSQLTTALNALQHAHEHYNK